MNNVTAEEVTTLTTKLIDKAYCAGRSSAFNEVLWVIEEAYFGAGQSEIDYHSRLIEGIGLLKGGDKE